MHIETKFSNGDRVFLATFWNKPEFINCVACNGTGKLKLEGRDAHATCIDCHGRRGENKYDYAPAARQLTIGRVGVEITESKGCEIPFGETVCRDGTGFTNYSPIVDRKEQYMCVETGIGTGSVYYVENLFHTEEEALKRAAVLIAERLEMDAEEIERRKRYAL